MQAMSIRTVITSKKEQANKHEEGSPRSLRKLTACPFKAGPSEHKRIVAPHHPWVE